jgi:hypothetical protein
LTHGFFGVNSILNSTQKGGFTMLKQIVWRRFLIITSGIGFLVIPILFWIMYLVKKDSTGIVAEEDIWVTHVGLFVVIQIFIFSALIRTSKGLLIAAGIVSILSGLLYLHFALAFIFTGVHKIGILFFISTGCNSITGLLALILRILWKDKQSVRLI